MELNNPKIETPGAQEALGRATMRATVIESGDYFNSLSGADQIPFGD